MEVQRDPGWDGHVRYDTEDEESEADMRNPRVQPRSLELAMLGFLATIDRLADGSRDNDNIIDAHTIAFRKQRDPGYGGQGDGDQDVDQGADDDHHATPAPATSDTTEQ